MLYTELRRRICVLEYPPGTRLAEAELADQFAVSRAPVRVVLARLEAEGLIESRHGSGTFVTDVDYEKMVRVYELRLRLATLMGELDPITINEDDLADWSGLCDEFRAFGSGLQTVQGYAEMIMKYHALILKRVGNSALYETMDRLYFQTVRVWINEINPVDWDREVLCTQAELDQHRRAIELRDVRGVAFAHRNAIAGSMERFREYFALRDR